MLKRFEIGQNSLEVCKVIVNNHPNIFSVKLLSHKVRDNWRQVYLDHSAKLQNLKDSFEHEKPEREISYNRERFLNLKLDQLEKVPNDQVWSFVSKVLCDDNTFRHISMMNFHPENVGMEAVRETVKHICGARSGCILDSGRFFHYYGDFLLDESDWLKFMAEFLMPCILVSPRYIGHRLHDGYCTLRLTTEKSYKPKLPEVIEVL